MTIGVTLVAYFNNKRALSTLKTVYTGNTNDPQQQTCSRGLPPNSKAREKMPRDTT